MYAKRIIFGGYCILFGLNAITFYSSLFLIIYVFFQSGGGVVLVHNMTSKPDRFQSIAGRVMDMDSASPSQLNYDTNIHGDFYFDDNNKEISYLGKTSLYHLISENVTV